MLGKKIQGEEDMGMPTVISLFAGCGGSSLGYKRAGFRELLAVDIDKDAVESFRLNFDTPVWCRDIRGITAAEIMGFCEIREGELDVLDGSPPCQGFSMAGKRELNDARNDLSFEFARILKGLKPKVFLAENVSGMIRGEMKGLFNEITKNFEGAGYDVSCKVMNSANFGVPQARERLIWIGIDRKFGVKPSFPEVSKDKRIITAEEALGNCPKSEEYPLDNKVASIMKCLRPGENAAKVSKMLYGKNSFFNYNRLDSKRPSPTITKSGPNLFHFSEDRYLTIAEVKRLCSYPDGFRLSGDFRRQWARLGESVMPRFMEALASHIRSGILTKLYEKEIIG